MHRPQANRTFFREGRSPILGEFAAVAGHERKHGISKHGIRQLAQSEAGLAMLLAEAPNPSQPLSVHLLDGPAADLQTLGQLPLAHSP